MTDQGAGLGVRVATVGLVGHSPVAPGTAGSIVGVAVAAGVHFLWKGGAAPEAITAILIILIYAVGVWSAGQAERFYGMTDPGAVVIDEVAGQMLALLALAGTGWPGIVAGFLLFRFFDV
ncbi:MAG: phosphatidylglycerophosphatase A, partial [Acidobacteriota bacterium]|nr:phosphatidylglycerophosphatase A [Acidobacteriota bacterium]